MPIKSAAQPQHALPYPQKIKNPVQGRTSDRILILRLSPQICRLKCLTLFGLGGVNGAYAGASAALDAGIGIDYVALITLRDSGHGTLTRASATLDAIAGNLISH